MITDSNVLRRLTPDLYALLAEASLSTKHTSGSTLACEAVADTDPNGFVSYYCGELATATGSDSCAHDSWEDEWLLTPNV